MSAFQVCLSCRHHDCLKIPPLTLVKSFVRGMYVQVEGNAISARMDDFADLLSSSASDGSLTSYVSNAALDLNSTADSLPNITGLATNVSATQVSEEVDFEQGYLNTLYATLADMEDRFSVVELKVQLCCFVFIFRASLNMKFH